MAALIVGSALAVSMSGCGEVERGPATAFSLLGFVVDVDEGAEPVGVPDDPDVADEPGHPKGGGSLVVLPDADVRPRGLTGCRTSGRMHRVYFNEHTEFDPSDVVRERHFPRSLAGWNVRLDGLVYPNPARDERSPCAIVARIVDVRDERRRGEG